jgi:hypothetical protein
VESGLALAGNSAAATNAVTAWRANDPDAGALLVSLPAAERRAALAALGYRD